MNFCKDNELYNISDLGNVIEKSDGQKLLGVAMDSIFNCGAHSRRIGAITRLSNFQKSLQRLTGRKLQLCKTVILSYLYLTLFDHATL